MKKSIGIFVIIIGLLCVILLSARAKSPYEFLEKKYGTTVNAKTPEEFIYQEKLDEDNYLVFYRNSQDNIICAVIKETDFFYKVLAVGDGISLGKENKEILPNMRGFAYETKEEANPEEKYCWVQWGVLKDNSIKRIWTEKLGDFKIIPLQEREYRIYYILCTEEKMPVDIEILFE